MSSNVLAPLHRRSRIRRHVSDVSRRETACPPAFISGEVVGGGGGGESQLQVPEAPLQQPQPIDKFSKEPVLVVPTASSFRVEHTSWWGSTFPA